MPKISTSPFRYPGGKSVLFDLLAGVIHNNDLRYCSYAEPYAGGCGLAVALLYAGYVKDIYINDIDPAIWSFWYSVLNCTDELINLINQVNVNLNEWEQQRLIYEKGDLSDPLSLGFATFFLNRTNRSGIIKGAGIIGGKNQTGTYKMDCRFNKEDLISKILRINKYKNRIFLTNMDAISFMKNMELLDKNIFFFIDPPYYNKGSSLYTNFYKPEDHANVCNYISKLTKPWLITYDNTEEIRELYKNYRKFSFEINYSLQKKRKGSEILITSDNIYIGNEINRYQSKEPD